MYTHYELVLGISEQEFAEILIFRLNKTRGLVMLNRGFYDWERSKVLVKSCSENRKPIRDGYTFTTVRKFYCRTQKY